MRWLVLLAAIPIGVLVWVVLVTNVFRPPPAADRLAGVTVAVAGYERDGTEPDRRLKVFLRSDAQGAWSFDTVRPGAYPGGKIPAHIHFEVAAAGRTPKLFEIVFEGDPFVTPGMKTDPDFSVRPIQNGRVTERIVLK